MTITNNIAAKLSVAFVAVAMAFSLVAPAAQAQDVSSMSLEELIALVNSLQAQLSGSSSAGACSYTFTRSLSQGSTGTDVMNLQKFLNMSADTQVAATGVGSAGSESSYYGALTAAAVSKFQTKYSADILVPVGLTSPTGYFGPSTMAKANSVCAASTGSGTGTGSTGSSALEGGAGSISDADYIAKLSNEEVGEDEEDVEVAGLELEADEGSDIELTAVNLNFSQGTAGSDFDKYASEVSVWVDGEEVARVDADEFTDDDNYDKTISLKTGGIIRAGETGELVVAVSGISNLDSTDATDTWTLEFESVRFRDAQGASVTDSATGDINDGTGRTFSFESFATAADVEFKVTSGDDDINDTQVVIVDDTNDTDNVELLSFEIEVEGDSEVDIDDMPVDLTSVGAGVGEIVNSLELWVDGDQIGSESVSSTTALTRTITFDNLDWQIEAGDTVEVVIKADINDTDGGFSDGATLTLDVNPDDSGWDIEDENGDDLAAADKTGTATTDAHLFYTIAPEITVVSADIDPIDNGNAAAESALATIEVQVTAKGGTLYLNGDDETTENKRFFVGDVYGSGTSASTTASSSVFTVISGTNDVTNSGADNEYYTLEEGESMTIRIEATVNQSTVTTTAILAGLKALQFNFGTAATSDTTRSATSFTYTDLIDATQTGTESLVNPS